MIKALILITIMMLAGPNGQQQSYSSLQVIKYNARGECIDSSIVSDKSIVTMDDKAMRVYLISPRLGTLMFNIMSIDYKFGSSAPVFIITDPYHRKSGLLMLDYRAGTAVLYFNNEIVKLGGVNAKKEKVPSHKR